MAPREAVLERLDGDALALQDGADPELVAR
jgi:hypothetical protein